MSLAKTSNRVPVEASTYAADGVPIWVLLHVLDGKLSELEVLRAGGEPLDSLPNVNSLAVSVRC